MVSKRRRLMALLLSVMMLLGMMTVGTLSASAASGSTVYCENAANWSTVYCYMWGDSGKNAEWPGIQMTQGSDGLWAYTPTDNWNNIIFNSGNGGTQTADLTLDGNCFNNSTNSWSTVNGGNTTDNTTPTTPDVDPTPTPSDGLAVYCRNTANWGSVYVYMWTDGAGENAKWPGQKATDLGDGIWEMQYTKEWKNIIFNDGGSTQTSDLTHAGSGMMYDNSTGSWEMYDTSKLHIKSFTADIASPQYTGVKINLAVNAGGGEGELSYQFSVGSTVISEYSSSSTASWTPATAGTYTVKVDVKDTLGETLSKSMTYEIKDIATEVKPVIQSVEVTPSNFENTELKKGTESTVDITAGGGNTGTKLLFYKVTITDPKGETANVPYYTLKNEYKFTPAQTGTYSVTASVQGSDNSFTARTVEYDCVDEFSKPGDLSASLSVKEAGDGKYTATANAAGGTAPYTYEFKLNGEVKQAASDKATYTFDAAAEGNYTVEVTVKDAAGKTVTKSTSVQVGGEEQPTDPQPTPPVDEPEELKVTLAVEDLGEGNYKFTANATGANGDYLYEFVANGAVVREYSESNTVTLKMTADGQYTIMVNVKSSSGDAAVDSASAEKVITISGGKVEMPLEADFTVTKSGEYLKAEATAIGGEGDYQYEFSVDGTVYQAYSDKNSLTFGLTADGNYSVSVNVKDAAGTVVTKSETVWVVDGEYHFGARPDEGGEDNTTTAPTDPVGDYLKGDADCNGKVNVKDATLIQKYIAKISDMTAQGMENGEVDGNGKLNVKDATMIQKFIANIIKW